MLTRFPECSLVAIGDESGLVRLLESSKDVEPGFGKDWYTIQCHENAVFDLSWSKDDHQFATASGDHTVRLFDVQKKALIGVFHEHRSSIKQVNHHPTNPFLLSSCSRDGDIHIWDTRVKATSTTDDGLASIKPVNSIIDAHTATSRRGKFSEVSVTAAIWLPTGNDTIVSACEANASIKFWDLRSTSSSRRTRAKQSPRCLAQSSLPQHHTLSSQRPYGINSLTLSLDGARLYALCRDSIIYTYATSHIEYGPIHAYHHPRLLASTFFVKTALSRDGKILAAGSSDGTPILFPTDESYLNKHQYPERASQKVPPPPPPSLTRESSSSQLDTPPPSQQSPSSSQSSSFSSPSSSQKLTPAQLASKYLPIGPGMPLVGGFDIEVTDLDWTMDGDLVAISDDRTARCFRGDGNGEEVEKLMAAETSAERWEWGYACEEEV
jgi:WD40 repeat protein